MSLLACMSAMAQPILNWVRPPFGTAKTYNMYQGSMPEPSAGSNQVWDYSSYTPISIGAGVYTDPSTLPASSFNKFPTATYVEVWNQPIAPSLDQAIIDYYHDYADSLVRLGQQGSGGGLANTWGDVQAVWNIGFGDSASARYFAYSNVLTSGSITYAGYGTLKTKYGVYNDVVLISSNGSRAFFQTTPYFGMLMNILYSSPTTIAGAYIYSYSSGTSVDELKPDQKAQIYTVEDSHKVNISMTNYCGKAKVKVYDAIGKLVFQEDLTFSNDTKIIELENVHGGFYLVSVEYDNTVQTVKVILNQ